MVWQGWARQGFAAGAISPAPAKQGDRLPSDPERDTMNTAAYRITGISPLLMHNGQAIDPLNQYAKEMKRISKKKNKTDEDQGIMSRVEFFMSLYHNGKPDAIQDGEITVDPNARLVLRDLGLEALIIGGAKKLKQGNSAKSGIIVEEDAILEYDGPRNINELWTGGKHVHRVPVRVGTARVMRTRPIFRVWSATIGVTFDQQVIDEPEIFAILKVAGQQVGIGDWRPRFGRFEVSRK